MQEGLLQAIRENNGAWEYPPNANRCRERSQRQEGPIAREPLKTCFSVHALMEMDQGKMNVFAFTGSCARDHGPRGQEHS
jgi:hypothetical protein